MPSPALHRRIRIGMTEPHPIRRGGVGMGFDALDAAAQSRERIHACAGHCARSFKVWTAIGSEENQKLAQLFMICSNIKLRGPTESIRIDAHEIH